MRINKKIVINLLYREIRLKNIHCTVYLYLYFFYLLFLGEINQAKEHFLVTYCLAGRRPLTKI